MSAPVAMLDHATHTVHRPATGEGMHLHTDCGLDLTEHTVTVGPRPVVEQALARTVTCDQCFEPF